MFRFLKDIIKYNRKNYIIGLFFLIIYYILKLFSPIFVKFVVDQLTNNQFQFKDFRIYSLILIIIPILLYVSCFIWGFNIYRSSNRLAYRLRKNMMNQFLHQFPAFYKKYTTGTLMGRATDNLMTYTDFAGFGLMTVFDGLIYPIFVIGLMVYTTNVTLTCLTLTPLILLAVLNVKIGGAFDKLNERISHTYEQMNDAVLRYTNGILSIRSYRLTDKFYDDYVNASKEYQKSVDDYYRAIYMFMMVGLVLPVLSTSIAIIYGYHLINTGIITIGSLVSFILFIRYLEWPMTALSELIHLYSSAKVGKKLIDEILDEPFLLQDGTKEVEKIQSVTFKQFNYAIDDQLILKDIDLTFKKGDFIGVVGKTGSGKTTLLKQLLRLNDVDKNCIFINDIPIEQYTMYSIRDHISYVAQEHTLFSKTIEENIAFGKPVENLEEILVKADIQKDVASFKEKEKTIVGEKGIMLSGGQKQRISLARALNKQSSLFILDDCLSALDNETQENIVTHLQKNLNENTLFVASHRLSIFKDATEIIVLDQGKIIERGNHDQLMALQGWYYNQFMYQKEGNHHG